jgi:transcriptional regulator with PAS, ATPase and Fis domain
MESELFGYEKGAFTGANTSKPGKFEEANTGTVFLDEIGDVTPAVQVKLLRILQEREFERLGSNKTIGIDVRVIAATNQDLRVALEQGTFREDLFYRLNVVPINIPPLRKRKEDIPYLAQYFLNKFARESGRQIEGLSEEAIQLLESHYWPGNVRELENVIERAVVLARSSRLTPEDIRLDDIHKKPVAADDLFLPPGMTLDDYEKWLIQEALRRAKGNKSQAARLLGITRNAFRYRLSQTGIENGDGED